MVGDGLERQRQECRCSGWESGGGESAWPVGNSLVKSQDCKAPRSLFNASPDASKVHNNRVTTLHHSGALRGLCD